MTFRSHLQFAALRGPAMAMAPQLAALVAVKSLGASDTQIALLAAALPAGNLLAVFWAGKMARSRRLPFLVWPDTIGMILLLLVGLTTNVNMFIALVGLSVIMRMATITALSGIMRENYLTPTLGRTMGKVQALTLASVSASALLFGYILEASNDAYRWLYPAVALLGMVAISRLRTIPEIDPADRKSRTNFRLRDFVSILRNDKNFSTYELSFFVFGSAALTFKVLLPLYLVRTLNQEYVNAAIAVTVLTSALPILTTPLWGRVMDKVNILTMRGSFNLVWACAPLIIYAFNTFEAVLVGQFLVGLILGGSMLIWNLGVNIFARSEDTPLYMGIHQSLTGVRGLIAPFIGVALAGWLGGDQGADYRTVFLFCGIVMICAGSFMLFEGKRMQASGRATSFTAIKKQD